MASENNGLRITYKDAQLQKYIKSYTRRGGRLKPLLQQIGEYIEEAADRRHSRGLNVDGSKFKPLSENYKKRKKKNKNKVLIKTNNMKNTLTWQLQPGSKSVRIGYGSEVAKYHMGDEPRRKMPLRNPLGVSSADKREIRNIAEDILLS